MDLIEITLKHLRKHPLFKPEHRVLTREISGGWWIGYRTTGSNHPQETTHFDVNILKDTFFVLHIAVEKEERGKGHGDALYKVLEEIARETKCKKVQMTASGQTPSGESRQDYLLRRGYKKFGIEVVKEFS